MVIPEFLKDEETFGISTGWLLTWFVLFWKVSCVRCYYKGNWFGLKTQNAERMDERHFTLSDEVSAPAFTFSSVFIF